MTEQTETMTGNREYTEAYAADHGRFAVIPAAYVLLRRGDEVLLQLRRGTGYYDEPLGLRRGRPCRAGRVAARGRRARDPRRARGAGRRVRPRGAHRHAPHRRDGRGDRRAHRCVLQATEWQGDPRLIEDKAAELGWFALDALPDPVVPHELAVLEALRERRLAPITPFGF